VFSIFKRPAFIRLIGFLLVALFVWFAGPYFAFADYRPLETETARLIVIFAIFACWAIWALVRWLRAAQASQKLVAAVVIPRREKEQPSAEATKLRERFEEAVAALTERRAPGRSLYELPWYVFIGAPGSGKTTALVNSGLSFPLEQRVGRNAVRGVGGTRNCDWWFTDEAVFLDTAGRYTTQDSDATSDSEGWREFLALLSKYRERRPLNGIVLTISAQDLLSQGDAGREAHEDAIRRRLDELTRELHVQLPVYVMVTKCDMLAGFVEYFDDLTQEDRAQVWGVTFRYEVSLRNEGPHASPTEFDALVARLNSRVFARLEEERGARRRAAIFAFPQQVAVLRDSLTQFVSDIFSSTRYDRQVLLRGVYLTSGTQDGTQIDRLLGSIGRRFGIAQEAVARGTGRGKAFFVEHLLKRVVIGESGLAGVNRRLELRKAAWQYAAYAAVVLGMAIGLIGLSVSYANNSEYLSQVAADTATLQPVAAATAAASIEVLLPHLDAVRAVADSANRYRDDTPWGMRWGLYQGTSVGNAARDAYLRELDSIVLPRFAARVRQRLVDYGPQPEKLYLYLKAYLMLGAPRRLDKKYLRSIADLEWRMPDTSPGAGTSLARHFQNLLEQADTLRPVAIDQSIVAQARSSISQASIPQIMYGQLQRSYLDDSTHDLHIDVLAVGIERVVRRRSGRPLTEPMPGLYTAPVFKEVTGRGMAPLVKQFAEEQWVWGGSGVGAASLLKLGSQVTDIYERDYARSWDSLLNDLEIRPFQTVDQYAEALRSLAGPTSPLRAILNVVVTNTSLIPPPDAASSVAGRIARGAKDAFSSAEQRITGSSTASAGTVVTQHFEPISRLMVGTPAPIDGIFEQVRKIRDALVRVGPQVGGASPLKSVTDPAVLELWRGLRQDAANLPPPVNTLVTQIAQYSGASVSADATRELETLYREQVVNPCRIRVSGRYPFGSGPDMAMTDFGELFGYGGFYDRFFTGNIEKLVDTSAHPWRWRAESVEPSPGILTQFEEADRIRQMFFPPASKAPSLTFNVRLSQLDSQATRLYVNFDGHDLAVTPGNVVREPFVWPDAKRHYAYATFEDRVAAPEQAKGFQGEWALFHLLDALNAQSHQSQAASDLSSVLTVWTPHHNALMTIEASNETSNPFATRVWRQFACER
jgi:type VI secretion system protein ImpL